MKPYRLTYLRGAVLGTDDFASLGDAFEHGRERRASGATEVEIRVVNPKPGRVRLYGVDVDGKLGALDLEPMRAQKPLGRDRKLAGGAIARRAR